MTRASRVIADGLLEMASELEKSREDCEEAKRRRRRRRRPRRRKIPTGEAGARVLASILSAIAFWERAGGLNSGRGRGPKGTGSSGGGSSDSSPIGGDD